MALGLSMPIASLSPCPSVARDCQEAEGWPECERPHRQRAPSPVPRRPVRHSRGGRRLAPVPAHPDLRLLKAYEQEVAPMDRGPSPD